MKVKPPSDETTSTTTPGTGDDGAGTGTTEASGEWLERFAHTGVALDVDRLTWDRRLLDRVMWDGYTGPAWEKFASRLVAYGLRVIQAWITTGEIVGKCAAKGWAQGLTNDPRVRRREVAEELAVDTVAAAIIKFRDEVLIPGKWDPTRGASLKTFFIGQALMCYRNAYRRWWRAERRQWELDKADPDRPEPTGTAYPAADLRILESERLAEMTHGIDPLTLAIAAYRAENWTWEEIAEITGLSVAAAKSRLSRIQKKMSREESA